MILSSQKYKQFSDETLMRKICKSDDKAFTELYERYNVKMYRYFLKMFFNNTEKAQDFMQELFLKIIEKPQNFNANYSFPHWVYTVASNMSKNEFRRVSNSRKHNNTHKNTMELYERPDFQFLQGEEKYPFFQEKLQNSLATLELKHRECFVLRYQEGFSVKEVSQILNCPEGTVKSRLFYCLKKLAKQLYTFQNHIE